MLTRQGLLSPLCLADLQAHGSIKIQTPGLAEGELMWGWWKVTDFIVMLQFLWPVPASPISYV